jgi:methane monooxygenase PmoA-like
VSVPAALEELPDRLVARHGDRVLFEYVFRPELARVLAPRPYFHPVRTLAGVEVTDHQPADHAWHLGLSHAWPVVDEWNFWGGPTYVRDRGYVALENHGEIRHLGWEGMREELEWLDPDGERVAVDRRVVGVPDVDPEKAAWFLELETDVECTGPRWLRLGSPTTEGRPLAGYAGLAWRGPDALRGAEVVLEDGPAAGDPMGRRSRWLALAGAGVTVALFEDPGNPGVPNRWFVRTAEYALVTSSPLFDRELVLAPGERLRLRHRLLFADGAWDASRLGRVAAALA